MTLISDKVAVEVDNLSPKGWSDALHEFADANVYQTHGYQAGLGASNKVSHLVVRRGAEIVSAAQVRLVKIPWLGLRIAYIRWGPLWQRSDCSAENSLREALQVLRQEYVVRRGHVLRIMTHLVDTGDDSVRQIFQSEGYSLISCIPRPRTILMDIRPSMDELYKGLHQKWRNSLNSARKHPFKIIEGEGEELITAFEPIYNQLKERKQFFSEAGFDRIKQIQRLLADQEKLRICLCTLEGEVCAGAICSAVGDTGLYLYGATSVGGTKCNASYLAQWRMIEWMKSRGCSFYNLNGINPETNEGTYRFKLRLAGVHGRDVYFLGCFDAYPNALIRRLVVLTDNLRRRLAESKLTRKISNRRRSGIGREASQRIENA